MLSPFDILAILLTLTAAFGALNYHYLRRPATVGLLLIALAASICLALADSLVPGLGVRAAVLPYLRTNELSQTFLQGILSFLLFAGALNVGTQQLWRRKWLILVLATGGVVVAAAVLAAAMWWAFAAVSAPVPFAWCVVLGVVVAPTDPVAVLGILKRAGLPGSLQAVVAGESLFNDGVAVVLTGVALTLAVGGGAVDPLAVPAALLVEAGGGALLGAATGYAAFLVLRRIDEAMLELTISLALVTATYAVADLLGVSGPIAVVVAGLITGNAATRWAMSRHTKEYINTIWTFVDEILNAMLFLVIGLEALFIVADLPHLLIGLAAVASALLARALSVALLTAPLLLASRDRRKGALVLVWGGLRGGISVALALTLPESPYRDPILTATYAVVIFTILVQGTTLDRLLKTLRIGDPLAAMGGGQRAEGG